MNKKEMPEEILKKNRKENADIYNIILCKKEKKIKECY